MNWKEEGQVNCEGEDGDAGRERERVRKRGERWIGKGHVEMEGEERKEEEENMEAEEWKEGRLSR